MPIVNTTVPVTSRLNQMYIKKLTEKYPFIRSEVLGRTAFQRPISTLVVGQGPRKVLFTASHHANEWITTLVLLKYAEELAEAIAAGGEIYGQDAAAFSEAVTIYMVPMVDPDGVDLVTGAVAPGDIQYDRAQRIALKYPDIPFVDGWKANLLGVDLNLNYPAGWLMAREIKYSEGYISPAPRDYVGRAPLNQLETQALSGYTDFIKPELVLAFHSQGEEIYWKFRNIPVPGAKELGEQMAAVSGYTLADVPYESGFAGFKDWFIQEYRKPGYTVEVGKGVNPLPLSQFDEIYQDNVGLLTVAALGGISA